MAEAGIFDIAFGKIKTALEVFAEEERLIDSAYDYKVDADVIRSVSGRQGAYVYLWLGPISPDIKGSGAYGPYAYTATYYMDLVVILKALRDGMNIARADEREGARLRYLIQQVFIALFRATSQKLDLPGGSIRGRPLPRVEPFPPEAQMMLEQPITAARVSLDLGFAWDPCPLTGVPLDIIHVDASSWSATYEFDPKT